jgi:hypothetical protein
MKTTLPLVIGFISILSQPLSAKGRRNQAPVDPPPAQNKVQIALLLDTSNSMDGLIDQAKTQLWKVVNTFIDARRDGAAPFVEVALYEYGNNSQPVGNNYIRLVQPLTRDLDEVSKQMFALKTNGGEEYCGAVIRRSLSDLTWDPDPKTYKAIFIAGNEPFTQGPVDVRSSCKDGFSKGIIINTIHCGNRDEGISGSWHDGAALAGGKFMIIDQDRAVCHIAAPQDDRISKLGEELNKTYLGYGKLRAESAAKQQEGDQSAAANKQSSARPARIIPMPRGTSSMPYAKSNSTSPVSRKTSCPIHCADSMRRNSMPASKKHPDCAPPSSLKSQPSTSNVRRSSPPKSRNRPPPAPRPSMR